MGSNGNNEEAPSVPLVGIERHPAFRIITVDEFNILAIELTGQVLALDRQGISIDLFTNYNDYVIRESGEMAQRILKQLQIELRLSTNMAGALARNILAYLDLTDGELEAIIQSIRDARVDHEPMNNE